MADGERNSLLVASSGEEAAYPSGAAGELRSARAAGLTTGTAFEQGLSRGGNRGDIGHGG
jgi:hypothetical protein